MKYNMKYLFTMLLATLLYGCNETAKDKSIEVTATQTDSGTTKIEGDTSKKSLATTTIAFAETAHDFGIIKEGEIVEYDFKFTNTGTHPLVISDAKASCGCTIPEWTKDPVLPNEAGKLKIKYNSSGKDGKIHKTVSVFANTTPELSTLDINVEVKAKDNSMGPLKK